MTTLFIISTFLFFLGMVKYLLYLAMRNKTLFILATIMIAAGFAFETVALVQRSIEITTLLFFLWSSTSSRTPGVSCWSANPMT